MKNKNQMSRYRRIKLNCYSGGLIDGLSIGCVLFAACPTGFYLGLKFCLAFLTIPSIIYRFYKLFGGGKNAKKRKNAEEQEA